MRFDSDGEEFYNEVVATPETPFEMDPLNIVNINLSGRVGGKIESIFDLLNSLIFDFGNQEEIGDYLKSQGVNPDEVLEDKKLYDDNLASSEQLSVIENIIVANMNIKMDKLNTKMNQIAKDLEEQKNENQELKEQLKDLKRQLSEAESEPKNQNGD